MKNLIKSFGYAFKGIASCIVKEHNLRIHLCFLTYMFYFLTVHDFFEVTKTQFAILIAVSALVISLELVNTGVESAVDLAADGKIMPLAKLAKDAAAGAVLVSAIGAVALGIVILYQPAAFSAMFEYYKTHISQFITLILTIVWSLIFIFQGPSKMFKKKK